MQRLELMDRLVHLGNFGRQPRSRLKLPHQIALRRGNVWVHLYCEFLGKTVARHDQLRRIFTGERQRSRAAPPAAAHTGRSRVAQIPYKSVHACLCRECFRGMDPVHRNVQGIWVHSCRRVFARIPPHKFPVTVQNFQRNRSGGAGFQEIVHNRTVWRILRLGLFGRERRALIGSRPNAVRGLRTKEPRIGGGNFRTVLAQRRHVIENPERAAMCGDDQVVAVNNQIAHRNHGQIEL